MKNKWLIVLFFLFMVVIFLSLAITRQSQKAVFLTGKEASLIPQAENRIVSNYPAQQAALTSTARLPLAKRGITIIKTPAIQQQSQEKSIRAPKIADQAANNVSSRNPASTTQVQDDLLGAGITKTSKQPTPQEAQEMNSSGIVLY